MASTSAGRGKDTEFIVLNPNLDEEIPFDKACKVGNLSNGMTYYVRNNVMPRNRAELRIVIKVGSIQESEKERGIAHMIEHLAFRATTGSREDFETVKELEKYGIKFGAHQNAYTAFEETVYELHVPTDKDGLLEKSLHILQQLALQVRLSDDDIQRERSIVEEEWRQSRGSGQRIAEDHLRLLLKDSLYADRLPIGLMDVIQNVSAETVRAFYKANYHPDSMAVIAVGDFPEGINAVVASIERIFGGDGLSAQVPRAARPPVVVPEHATPRVKIYKDPEATSTGINIDIKQPRKLLVTVRDYREYVIGELFFECVTTRLAKVASASRPPFLSAQCGSSPNVSAIQTVSLAVSCRDGNEAIRIALEAALAEVGRVKAHGLTEREVNIAKRNREKEMHSQWLERDKTHSNSLSSELADHFLLAEPAPGVDWEAGVLKSLLETITAKEVADVVQQFHFSHDTVVYITTPCNSGGLWSKAKKAIDLGRASGEGREPKDELTEEHVAAAIARHAQESGLTFEPWIGEDVELVDLLPKHIEPGRVVATRHFKGCTHVCRSNDSEEKTENLEVGVGVGGEGDARQGGGGEVELELQADVKEGGSSESEKERRKRKTEGINLHELDLSNGIKVTYRCSDYQDDEIVFKGYANGGLSELADEYVASGYSSTTIAEEFGIYGVEPQRALDMLAGTRITFNPFVETYARGITGSCSTNDLESCLQCLLIFFTAKIQWDDDRLKTVMDMVHEAIVNRNKDPISVYQSLLDEINTQGHLHFQAPTLKLLAQVHPAYAMQFFLFAFRNPVDFRFVFCGNIDPQTAIPLFEKYLGGLQPVGPTTASTITLPSLSPPAAADGEIKFSAGLHSDSGWRAGGAILGTADVRPLDVKFPSKKVVKMLAVPMKDGMAVSTTTFPLTLGGKMHPTHRLRLEDNVVVHFVGNILERRLMEVLRFNLGSIYTIGVGFNAAGKPCIAPDCPLVGLLSITLTCKPGEVNALQDRIIREIKRLQTEGPEDFEVQNAIIADESIRVTAVRTNSYWLSSICAQYQSPRLAAAGDVAATYDEAERVRTDICKRMNAAMIKEAFVYFFKDLGARTEVSLVPRRRRRLATASILLVAGVAVAVAFRARRR